MDFGRSTDRGKKKGAVLELPEGMVGIRGARVLLVDDNRLNQVFAGDFLKFARITVDLAVNGEEAVRAVADAAEPYDAVLMDMQMPVMDGLEATRIIRQDPSNADLPIIATSANTQREEWQRCLEAGMSDSLPKPFLIPQLCAMLTRWIPAGDRVPMDTNEVVAREEIVSRENVIPDEDEVPRVDSVVPRVDSVPRENNIPHEDSVPREDRVAAEDSVERGIVTEIHLPDLIEGIDTKVGLSRAVGNRRLYADLLNDFSDTNATLAEDVRSAAEAGDLERARFLVHSLKSTAGNIGAEALYAEAAELEAQLVAWQERLAKLLGTFQGNLDGVVSAIRAAEIRVLMEPRQRAEKPFNLEEARVQAEMLWKMLEFHSLGARDQLDKFSECLGGGESEVSLERLARSLDALEFSEAGEILRQVCEDYLQ